MNKYSPSDSLRISSLIQLKILPQKRGIMGLIAVLLVCGLGKPEASNILVPLALDGHGSKVVVARKGTILNRYERLGQDIRSGDRDLLLGEHVYEAGELLLIIETGDVSTFEFARIKEVACERILLRHGLIHDYSTQIGTQVIQVPEYHSLRVKADASITAPIWNGQTGGIIAIATDSILTIQKGGELSVRGLGDAGDGGAIFVLSPELRGKGRIDASGVSLLKVPYGIDEMEQLGKGHPGSVMVWGEHMRDLQVFAEGDGAGIIGLPPRALATCYGSGQGIYSQTTKSQWVEE